MIKYTVALFAAAALLTACGGPSATQGVTKAGERKSGFMGLSKSDSIEVETAEAFKGDRPVVIGGFAVAFITHKTASAKAGGGLMGSGFGGKSTAKSDLLGVGDATFQKITDEIYSKFVADLKAKGYNIADRGQMLASEPFKSVTITPSPAADDTGSLLKAGNTTKYFAPSSFNGLVGFPGVPVGTGFAFSNPSMAAALYAKNGPRVIYAHYVVDFSNAESYGSWATSTSTVNVGQGVTVVPDGTRIGIIGGEGGTFSTNIGAIKLGQPISSDKEFATVTDATSDTARGVEIATNIVGALGGIGTNASRSFEFTADPVKYQAAAGDALAQANAALVGKMQSLK